jgi:hypothetical protein
MFYLHDASHFCIVVTWQEESVDANTTLSN